MEIRNLSDYAKNHAENKKKKILGGNIAHSYRSISKVTCTI